MPKFAWISGEFADSASIAEFQKDSEFAFLLFFSDDNPRYETHSVGLSREEVGAILRSRREELDRVSSFSLLSYIEALIRMDCIERCTRKLKDPLSKRFREIYKKRDRKASLEDEILEAWRVEQPNAKSVISELKGAMNYRHWLAHGRYWKPKLGRRYDHVTISQLTDSIVTSLGLTVPER